MSEEPSPNSETKDIVWDARELATQVDKRVGRPIKPVSIALLLGTGAFLLFYQAFLRRLIQRFGEDSANYLADRIRDLGGTIGELQLSRNSLAGRQGNGIRQLLSRITIGDSKRVRHGQAGRTQASAADNDSLVYSVVVISISQFVGRRKS
jgi:hypothetical protein